MEYTVERTRLPTGLICNKYLHRHSHKVASNRVLSYLSHSVTRKGSRPPVVGLGKFRTYLVFRLLPP